MDIVLKAAEALRQGETIVVHDAGVCLLAARADSIDAEEVNRFASAGGVIGVAMAAERVDALGLESMGEHSKSASRATVSVDSTDGTTGISAHDRAATLHALCADAPDGRLVSPGHVFPLRVADGDILEELSTAAACVALAREAGIIPVIAICEILDDEGGVLSPEDLPTRPELSRLVSVPIRAVLAHRRGFETLDQCDQASFQDTMSRLVSGVAAVTVRDGDGTPKGMLATSITSYTANPPSLLVCVGHSSRTHDPLLGAAGFGIHLLGSDQAEVATRLAGKHEDKFAEIDWGWDGDVPRIVGASAYLRCIKSASFVHHDHSILIGEIEVALTSSTPPLIYFQRSFAWQLGEQLSVAN